MASKTKLRHKPRTKQDLLLAIILGIVIVSVGIIVTRYSKADANKSFTRDPVTQMQGGTLVKKSTGQHVRIASQTAPGVNPVYSIVSKKEMANTLKVCVDYIVKKPSTFINIAYHSPAQGLATSQGTTKNSGGGTECVTTGGQAVDGTINVNVTPGAAQITSIYGVYREWDD